MGLDPLVWGTLDKSHVGCLITLVVERLEQGWKNPVTGQRFRLDEACDVGSLCACHLFRVASCSSAGVVDLIRDCDSQVISFVKDSYDFSTFVEVCAGMAGTSAGAVFAGLRPLAAMDKTSLAVEFLTSNDFPQPLLGDMVDRKAWLLLHQSSQSGCGMLAGFPCQPFASLGWHGQFQDARAHIFFRILDLSFIMNSSFLLLECVKGAGTNEVVTQTLGDYCRIRGFHWVGVVLKLENAWPCRRQRWWALVLPQSIRLPALRDLPCLGGVQVCQWIPEWPLWPLEEEMKLKLDDKELAGIANPEYGTHDRRLDVRQPCPTLLHSMGFQFQDCPCGCRRALSHELLVRQGLHGVVVVSRHDAVGLRHLHPKEAALLLGVPGTMKTGDQLRQTLPLLGQIASPLQSHWMICMMQESVNGNSEGCTMQRHDVLRKQLHDSHMKRWPTLGMFHEREVRVHFEQEPSVAFTLRTPITAGGLLGAHTALENGGEKLELYGKNGLLEDDELLIEEDYVLWSVREGNGKHPVFVDLEVSNLSVSGGLDDLTMLQEAKKLLTRAGIIHHALWSPRHISLILEQRTAAALTDIRACLSDDIERYYGFLWHDEHWLFFSFSRPVENFVIDFYDGIHDPLPADADLLASRFAQAFGLIEYQIHHHVLVAQTRGAHCGTIALAHMGLLLRLWPSIDESTVELWHEVIRLRQRRTGCGPNDDKGTITALSELLHAKGVPIAAAEGRARAALKKLGIHAVQAALSKKDAWRALKELGGSQTKPFQFVLYQELQTHIERRALDQKGADRRGKTKKQVSRKPPPDIQLVPEQLALISGSFVDEAGDEVLEITEHEVINDARGIAIVTPESAIDLASNSQNLSIDALAVITIGHLNPEVANAECESLRWPAFFKPTQEPVLITGTLVNLGDSKVQRASQENVPVVPQLKTNVIRVQIFRDMFPQEWSVLEQGPVRHLIAQTDSLQLCSGNDCGKTCSKFHAPVDETLTAVILDAWSWKWLNFENRTVKSHTADVFSVYLRIPTSALTDLLAVSGWGGVFVEPRTAPDGSEGGVYKVIWLAKTTTLEEARRHKRNHDPIVGLARLKHKLGLRVMAKDEQTILKIVYPNTKVQNCDVHQTFEVGPLPFAITRDQVAELLGRWNWKARPLRPLRSSKDGKYWEVGAPLPPDSLLKFTDQGDVTITPSKMHQEKFVASRMVQASSRTKNMMRTDAPASASTDPWSGGADPWSSYAWKNYVPPSQTKSTRQDETSGEQAKPLSKACILEKELKDLKSKVHSGAASMEVDGGGELMTQVTELKAQNAKYDSWFAEVGQRVSGLEGQLQQQGSQIQELGAAMQAQQTATDEVKGQLTDMQIAWKDELRTVMDTQTSRIEALFEKRQKC